MDREFKRINIALIIPSTVASLACALSEQIAQADRTFFILDNRNYFPHISLYAPEFPAGMENKIEYALGEIVEKHGAIACQFDKASGAADGGVYINLKANEEIKKLCADVVAALNQIREGHIRKRYADAEYQSKRSDKQISYINKHGFWRINEFFEPHIMLSVVEPGDQAKAIAGKIIWPIKEFTCSSIGMFSTGQWGTCTKLIRKISLNG